MRRIEPLLLIASVVGGCSGDDAADPAVVEAHARCAVVDSLRFPRATVDQKAQRVVYFKNPGASVARDLAISIEGPDAEAFTIDPFSTTCADGGALVPGGVCAIVLVLESEVEGSKSATLRIGAATVALDGEVAPRTESMFSTIANLDFVNGSGGFFNVLVSNQGSTPVTLTGNKAAIDGFELDAFNMCQPTLALGAACQVQISVAHLSVGCVEGVLEIGTDAGMLEIPVTSEHFAIPSVVVGGAGAGRVISTPGGIDCTKEGGSCAMIGVGSSLDLTAVPEAGNFFNGWSLPECGLSPQCTITLGPFEANSVMAEFVPSSYRAIHVNVAGGGAGAVLLGDARLLCTDACTTYVPDEAVGSTLEVVSFSSFTRWSGGCVGTTTRCDLGLVLNDRDVTAEIVKTDREQETSVILGHGWITNTYALPDGDRLAVGGIGDLTRVARIDERGRRLWTRLFRHTRGVVTTASGGIFVVVGPNEAVRLHRLADDGTTTWSVAPVVANPGALFAFGEDIIVAGSSSGFEVRAGSDGAAKWMQSTTAPVDDVAVDPTVRSLAVSVGNEIHRFDATGASLGASWTAPGPISPYRLAYDAVGRLVVLSDASVFADPGTSPAMLTRFSTTGTQDFSVPLDGTLATGGGDVVVTTSGAIVTLRAHRIPFSGFSVGAYLEVYDDNGTLTWRLEKSGTKGGFASAPTGFLGGTLEVGPGTLFTVKGGYAPGVYAEVWQSFAP